MSDAGPELLVDAHVHVQPCFDPEAALDAASANLARAAHGADHTGVLLLAEPDAEDPFAVLRASAWRRWELTPLAGAAGAWARRPGARPLLLVAGFQVPTGEGLEVLALFTPRRPEDGAPLDRLVAAVRDAGGLPVIPWGAGKWWGRRGAVLRGFLDSAVAEHVCLGDNAGRPGFWSRPRHFAQARARGIPILPGSDPLPFASEVGRVASHGFAIAGEAPGGDDALGALPRLVASARILRTWGEPEGAVRFLRHQLAMQVVRRRRAA